MAIGSDLTLISSHLSFVLLSLEIIQINCIRSSFLDPSHWFIRTLSFFFLSHFFSHTIPREDLSTQKTDDYLFNRYDILTYFKKTIFKVSEWNTIVHSTYAHDSSVMCLSFS